jgi:glucokinase
LNVSTALAAAFVLGGRVHEGADQASGQIGHIIVQPDGRQCGCGRRGCLDAVASGDALVALAAEHGWQYDSFSALLRAAGGGDPRAMTLLDQSARQVGAVVGDLITTLNPAVVAVSGMVLPTRCSVFISQRWLHPVPGSNDGLNWATTTFSTSTSLS